MLREVGKINYQEEYEYLQRNYSTMPRTMLRYAIEKFDEEVRQDFLKGRIMQRACVCVYKNNDWLLK